jgi:DNA-binding NarL/FixJ family response regulator
MSARRQTITDSEGSSRKTRVLIVDDHPMTRSGLAYLINHQPDMTTCCEAQNAAEALEGVLDTRPDLVLTDFTLPDKNGLELIKDIRAVRPDLPILVISMHEESLYAERVLRAGARGYITKEEGGERLMRAIRHVLSGTIYVSDKMSAQILELFSGGSSRQQQRSLVQSLSDREFEIFELLGKGLSTQQIANRLCLSMKTVSAHRANIKEKLELRTTNELIAYAARWIASRVRGPSPIGDNA